MSEEKGFSLRMLDALGLGLFEGAGICVGCFGYLGLLEAISKALRWLGL